MLVMVLKFLFILVALVMTFFILLQEGKGGGLAGLGGTKAAGVEGVTNPIRRATAVLSIIFFLLAILLGVMARPSSRDRTDGLFDAGTQDVEATAPAAASVKNEVTAPANPVVPAVKPTDASEVKPVAKPDAQVVTPEGAAAKPDAKLAEDPVPTPVAPEEKAQ